MNIRLINTLTDANFGIVNHINICNMYITMDNCWMGQSIQT